MLADGFTLTLNEALEYTHLGVTQSIAGRNIEYRGKYYFFNLQIDAMFLF